VLVQGDAVTLAIDEVPELHQASVPAPTELEPVTRLVRYDASDRNALVRAGDVAIEGELWRVIARGELTWVMSAKTHERASCDRIAYDCGYVSRLGLIVTGYRFAQGGWEVVQRVELRMRERAWATPEGFAGFEGTGDAEGNSTGGTIQVVRFGADGLLGDPVELHVQPQLAWEAPLSLASDQARVLLRDPHDGSAQLAIFDLASGELKSLANNLGARADRATRFTAHGLYLGDESSQLGAVFVDTSDASKPIATRLPGAIARAIALDDDGTKVLGISAGSSGNTLTFTLLRQQNGAFSTIDSATIDGVVATSDSDALWVDGEHVFFGYQRQDGSYALGLVNVSDTTVTPIAIVAEGYPDDVVALPDVVYLPDSFGLHAVPLDDGVDGPRVDWSGEGSVDAIAVGPDYEAALMRDAGGALALEITSDVASQRFAVGPGAERLIADRERVLLIASEPVDQCEQSGADCSDYQPNVAVYAVDGTPRLLGTVPLPDAALGHDSTGQVRLEWQIEAQGFALGNDRFLFVAELDATCTSDPACQALGIVARPIGESGVNVALPGVAPCPPGVAKCDQPEPPPAPTVYGEKRTQRLYVLDASSDPPSFGAAAESVLERRASIFGAPVISEGRVLATRIERDPPKITPDVSSVPADTASFMLDRFELGADGALHALPALNVPGYPLALRDDGALLITVEPDATREGAATLHSLALRDDGAHLVQSLALDARYAEIEVDADRAFYLRRDGEGCTGSSVLVPIALPDDEQGKLRAGAELALPGADWSIAELRDGRLLLDSGSQRFSVIDVSGETPELQTFVCGAGYLERPQLNGDEIVGGGGLSGSVRVAL
jgi:hypothetical protein